MNFQHIIMAAKDDISPALDRKERATRMTSSVILQLLVLLGKILYYVAALVRLHALLKSGGKIVVSTTDRKEQVTSTETSHTAGSQEFFVLQLSRDFISKSLKQAGFCNIEVTVHPRPNFRPDEPNLDILSFNFITASKMN